MLLSIIVFFIFFRLCYRLLYAKNVQDFIVRMCKQMKDIIFKKRII